MEYIQGKPDPANQQQAPNPVEIEQEDDLLLEKPKKHPLVLAGLIVGGVVLLGGITFAIALFAQAMKGPDFEAVQKALVASAAPYTELSTANFAVVRKDAAVLTGVPASKDDMKELYQDLLDTADKVSTAQERVDALIAPSNDRGLKKEYAVFVQKRQKAWREYGAPEGYAHKVIRSSKIQQAGCTADGLRKSMTVVTADEAKSFVKMGKVCKALFEGMIAEKDVELGPLKEYVEWGAPFFTNAVKQYEKMVTDQALDTKVITATTKELEKHSREVEDRLLGIADDKILLDHMEVIENFQQYIINRISKRS